jgi:hypothetical protein
MANHRHTGSCHCGAVRYQVELDLEQPVSRCNCRLCTKLGQTGAIVKPAAFELVQGDAVLREHRSNPIAGRFSCGSCGIYLFSRGHLDAVGGDFVSVNVNTVDGLDPAALTVQHWDGRHDNWQAGARPAPWPVHREIEPVMAANEAAAGN